MLPKDEKPNITQPRIVLVIDRSWSMSKPVDKAPFDNALRYANTIKSDKTKYGYDAVDVWVFPRHCKQLDSPSSGLCKNEKEIPEEPLDTHINLDKLRPNDGGFSGITETLENVQKYYQENYIDASTKGGLSREARKGMLHVVLLSDGKQCASQSDWDNGTCFEKKTTEEFQEFLEFTNFKLLDVNEKLTPKEVVQNFYGDEQYDYIRRAEKHLLALDAERSAVMVGNDDGWHCSGVLLDPNWMLTAKHCLPVTRVARRESVTDTTPIVNVEEVYIHESKQLDAVLVRLDASLEDTPKLQLYEVRDDGEEPHGEAIQMGYGVNSWTQETFGYRQQRQLPIEGWQCTMRTSTRYGCYPRHEFVAASNDGRDTCMGDSGSPVFFYKKSGDTCVPTLLGLTSRGIPSAHGVCGYGGIYVRADRLREWIEDTINHYDSKKKEGK